jgi:hypothetical protein
MNHCCGIGGVALCCYCVLIVIPKSKGRGESVADWFWCFGGLFCRER